MVAETEEVPVKAQPGRARRTEALAATSAMAQDDEEDEEEEEEEEEDHDEEKFASVGKTDAKRQAVPAEQ